MTTFDQISNDKYVNTATNLDAYILTIFYILS